MEPIKNVVIFKPLGTLAKYHLKYIFLLSMVPLFCAAVLMTLLNIFSKLNLYYLETGGLIIDSQVRDAYFSQVEMEVLNLVWFFGLQFVVTLAVSIVALRWASAPFSNAEKMIKLAMENPDRLKKQSPWSSESIAFDQSVWQFVTAVRSGEAYPPAKDYPEHIGINIKYFIKFCGIFFFVSLCTGYVLGSIIGSVYEKIVSLAIQLVPNAKTLEHYFIAQQEILSDATTLTTTISLVAYFFIGMNIARYMSVMIFVFGRALHKNAFPVTLRKNDIYHSLADVMNKAWAKIGTK